MQIQKYYKYTNVYPLIYIDTEQSVRITDVLCNLLMAKSEKKKKKKRQQDIWWWVL